MITRLRAENFKRLRAVSIEPDGTLVRITGRNAQGKSSVLDAIFAALVGRDAIPGEPIRRGAEKGEVEIHLDDPPVIVRRTFTAKTTQLVVESRDGARFPSPQRMLDELLGKITFDPLAFLALKPAEQVDRLLAVVRFKTDPEELEKLAPGSLIDDPIRRLALRFEQVYQERTGDNRVVTQIEGELAGIKLEGAAPTSTVNVADLVKKRDAILNEQNRRAAQDVEQQRLMARYAEVEAQIAKLNRELSDLYRTIETIGQEKEKREPIEDTLAALDEQIESAEAVNERYAQEQRKAEVTARLAAAKASADQKTKTLEAIRAFKERLLREADMPVPTLGFRGTGNEAHVTLDGIPLDQASQAEQIRVSAGIAMAVAPRLKVMLVREGSLLDEDGVRLLHDLAAARGFQVWIEEVDSTGKVGVVIENGEVVAVNREERLASLDKIREDAARG